jgi:hypothetical protein
LVTLSYEVGTRSETTLEIYDVAGRLVERLVHRVSTPGNYDATWNTAGVSKGVYLVRFKSGNSYATRKIVLVK